MDYLATSETFTLWLGLYGNWALFILLALGIIALPVPEESLMILAGLLIYNGKLNAVPTFFASFGGSVCGITVSYLLGIALGAL